MKKILLLIFGCSYLIGAKPLVVSFDGKGTAMSWDVGVLRALYENLDPDKVSEYIFVGASSGSILSAHFACKGFTKEAIVQMIEATKKFPKEVLNEGTGKRSVQLFLGVDPEISIKEVQGILNEATASKTCVPKYPLLIVTSNLDVTDGRVRKPFSGKRGRKFNQKTYELSELGKVRGKVCTYFVNAPMKELLKNLPAEERLCDLRTIRTAEDLELAIRASISEPTYFPKVKETDLTQIESLYPIPESRYYGGGFVMNSAVQDVKRVLGDAWIFGTGRVHYTRLQDRVIKNWFSFPMNVTLMDQRYWFDTQIELTVEEWEYLYKKEVTPAKQMGLGYQRTLGCFAKDDCLPAIYTKPHFSKDLKGVDLSDKTRRRMKPLLRTNAVKVNWF